jgi:predicted phage-related endonuclease
MAQHEITSRDQWLELRAPNIGASEVAALLDVPLPNYALSKWSLWQIMSGRANRYSLDDNDVLLAGRSFEKPIADVISDRLQLGLINGLYYTHPRIERFGATPDFIIIAKHPEVDEIKEFMKKYDLDINAFGVMECKNINWFEFKKSWLTSGELDPPQHVHIQVQSQLACTDAQWGCIAVCAGGNQFMYYLEPRHDSLISAIENAVIEFFSSIKSGKEPPIDGGANTSKILQSIYPKDDGNDDPIDLCFDNELPSLCCDYIEANNQKRHWQKMQDHIGNEIAAKIGSCKSAVTMGYRINYPLLTRRSYEVKETTYRKLTIKPLAEDV